MSDLVVNSRITIPARELTEHFVRASGPGGQNVNKVASAVELRFDVLHSSSLADSVRVALMRLAGHRLSHQGVIVIHARRFREQERNRADARARLADLILRAARPPRPRKPTRPPKASKERRLADKKRRGLLKHSRAPRIED